MNLISFQLSGPVPLHSIDHESQEYVQPEDYHQPDVQHHHELPKEHHLQIDMI